MAMLCVECDANSLGKWLGSLHFSMVNPCRLHGESFGMVCVMTCGFLVDRIF